MPALSLFQQAGSDLACMTPSIYPQFCPTPLNSPHFWISILLALRLARLPLILAHLPQQMRSFVTLRLIHLQMRFKITVQLDTDLRVEPMPARLIANRLYVSSLPML